MTMTSGTIVPQPPTTGFGAVAGDVAGPPKYGLTRIDALQLYVGGSAPLRRSAFLAPSGCANRGRRNEKARSAAAASPSLSLTAQGVKFGPADPYAIAGTRLRRA